MDIQNRRRFLGNLGPLNNGARFRRRVLVNHSLPAEKNQRPLRSSYTREGVDSRSSPTKLREVEEVLFSQRTHRIHLCGRQHVTGSRGCQAFSVTLATEFH